MARKESGFNQSVAASDMTFSMLASRARQGMVKLQRQHFFNTETQFAIQSQVT